MKEERKRILKMVEDGKLSVEEALTLLEKLEKAEDTAEQKQEEIIKELSTAVKFEEEKKKSLLIINLIQQKIRSLILSTLHLKRLKMSI